MRKKERKNKYFRQKLWTHIASITFLTVPNITYLACNYNILKEANAIAVTMTALLVFSIVGLGALTHIKPKGGIWVMLIGVFILALSNISNIAGIALLIEGAGVSLDGYLFKPLAKKIKMEELKANGESITYTREIK